MSTTLFVIGYLIVPALVAIAVELWQIFIWKESLKLADRIADYWSYVAPSWVAFGLGSWEWLWVFLAIVGYVAARLIDLKRLPHRAELAHDLTHAAFGSGAGQLFIAGVFFLQRAQEAFPSMPELPLP